VLRTMNYGARVAVLGIPPEPITSVNLHDMVFKGLILKGIYGREMFETWYKMTTMLQSGLDISPVITHRFAIDDYAEAFDVMRSGRAGKVILNWR
jgi:threonine 3-dehydrogenase